jgi:hypothetical protein
MEANPSSYIDRKTASEILHVSVRTIDRYIRSGKLWALAENGRIWLDKKEILKFTPGRQKREMTSIDRPLSRDHDFYRDLYEEARRGLGDYQQKLEQANYRIGQLESQIIHPPPPRPERHENLLSMELLQKELQEREKELAAYKGFLKKERSGRIILSLLIYLLLALLPALWYFLR